MILVDRRSIKSEYLRKKWWALASKVQEMRHLFSYRKGGNADGSEHGDPELAVRRYERGHRGPVRLRRAVLLPGTNILSRPT